MTKLIKGLRTLRVANIISIVSMALTMIGIIVLIASGTFAVAGGETTLSKGLVITAGAGGLIALISIIFVLVANILEIVALVKMKSIHSGYKTALILVLIGIVASISLLFCPFLRSLPKLMEILPTIISCLVVYFVIDATVSFLKNKGDTTLADKGNKVIRIYIVCTAITIVANFVTLIPALATVVSIVTLVTSVVQLVAIFKYIGFLGQSATSLESESMS
ncbi:MAG: hypothetical protein RSA60_08040 [Eubacterium sp.]